jgi:hypothetical protein
VSPLSRDFTRCGICDFPHIRRVDAQVWPHRSVEPPGLDFWEYRQQMRHNGVSEIPPLHCPESFTEWFFQLEPAAQVGAGPALKATTFRTIVRLHGLSRDVLAPQLYTALRSFSKIHHKAWGSVFVPLDGEDLDLVSNEAPKNRELGVRRLGTSEFSCFGVWKEACFHELAQLLGRRHLRCWLNTSRPTGVSWATREARSITPNGPRVETCGKFYPPGTLLK